MSKPVLYPASCLVLQKTQKMQCLQITTRAKEMSHCGRESGQLDIVKAA